MAREWGQRCSGDVSAAGAHVGWIVCGAREAALVLAMLARGAGAQLNSRRLRVSPSDELRGALIGIDPTDLDPILLSGIQTTLLQAGCAPRMLGETTLDLLQVAAGRYRAGWGLPTSPAGLHAAALILQEAGGICGTESGSPALAAGKELLFANPRIFKQLVKIRHQAGA